MIKLVVSFILFFLISTNNKASLISSCNDFYNKTSLNNVLIDGKVLNKRITKKSYNLIIEDKNGKPQEIILFKNSIGKVIFTFVNKGDLIKKDKETIMIRIAHFTEDKNVEVKIFDSLCE